MRKALLAAYASPLVLAGVMVAVHSAPNNARPFGWAALVAQGRQWAGASRSSAGACTTSGVPIYSRSPRQLVACGFVIYPLVSITRENVDGEVISNYNYNVSGRINTLFYPPASFKALTAPNAVLEAVGTPPRPPSGSATYANWMALYGSQTGTSWVEPTPFLIGGTHCMQTAPATASKTYYSRTCNLPK